MKAPLLLLVALLIATPVGTGTAPETVSYHLDLGPDSWAAIRFNITAGTDLVTGSQTRYCTGTGADYRAVLGGADWSIYDGVPKLVAIGPGEQMQGFGDVDEPVTFSDVARASIAGVTLTSPSRNNAEGCRGIGDASICHLCRFSNVNESVVLMFAAMGERTSFDFNAQWTTGVNSHDVAYGPLAAVRRTGDADYGADASIYAPLAPAAWVSLQTRHVFHTEGDVIGYFVPEYPSTGGVTDYSCTRNDDSCDLSPHGLNHPALLATEPSDWDITLDVNARASTAAYYYLSVVEFPDNTWID